MKQERKKYPEYKNLDLPKIDKEILDFWKQENIFAKSISDRKDNNPFIFYEGPPSANGTPGIHHVLSRTIKDIFCRYKTMQQFLVERKGGWDTHGLPVELGVEKLLGITKDDIGKKISVEEYNAICRREVMKFKDEWDELTNIMGYWVNLDDPYITFEKKYIETLWYLLKELYKKKLLYKGYSIQPYSPAAGTGLSSHELNMPGSYRAVKDTSIVAQFKIKKSGHALENNLFSDDAESFLLAWTTTPWTLPSNTALAVGKNIEYKLIETFNPYTFKPIRVLIAADRIASYLKSENENSENYEPGAKEIAWKQLQSFKGIALEGLRYEQLIPLAQPEDGDAFKVVTADFVSTEDGTGIVHLAPSFGADDFRTAQQKGIGSLTLVDKQGKFISDAGFLAGKYVKDYKDELHWENPDVLIAIKLKEENRAFKVEKYEHNYPHCWRTDKPVIYYPLDSWFIKTTAVKKRLLELNATINWKPKSTGEGRFAQWLENLVDWNLSRSRYWGTPLPIWRTEDGEEEICIGSIKELTEEYLKAQAAGLNTNLNFEVIDDALDIDLHKPFTDEIVLVSASGKAMYRESDLIDVWFDSGAMPYAQWHYPFENKEQFEKNFPADFIAEGVDQTRGWFFTLHVIACMLFDSVAYKNVISNGLVLDKKGNKMSKRLGNTVNPFDSIYKYGADANRWYMITNAQPWDNLKFDEEGLVEAQRKFFGTLFNTYSFFVLYANVDGFDNSEKEIPVSERPELDRWIISSLNTLIQNVTESYNNYEPTRAGRLIQEFVSDHLSNWYVRLSRRRFWKGEPSKDKTSAYQTLYTCLETTAHLIAPIAPFFAEFLYRNLNTTTGKNPVESVHLSIFPKADTSLIDTNLEEQMEMAQDISSTILSLRKKENIKVRQPLQRAMIPVLQSSVKTQLQHVAPLIQAEVNVRALEFIDDTSGIITKKIKPNFKTLGPKLGADMKLAVEAIGNFSQQDIVNFENSGKAILNLNGRHIELERIDAEIISEDIPGWLVAPAGKLTVALDVNLTDSLIEEGHARELVSKLQKLRKDMDLEITDKIKVQISPEPLLHSALVNYNNYICSEILADELLETVDLSEFTEIEVNNIAVKVNLIKT
ncbi:MAG: isoleucine--tRNA ligase [Chitinophagales bacterium]|nr:isoleucine--tRNA ligase [Chitinophagales bacterium]MBP9705179.1 isoleucine--tRNA ligase [Chitinophagales bacterium]